MLLGKPGITVPIVQVTHVGTIEYIFKYRIVSGPVIIFHLLDRLPFIGLALVHVKFW